MEWLGEVPEHWLMGAFKHMAWIRNGRDYKDVESLEGNYPVIGSGGQFSKATHFLYDGESVLLGRKGTIDKPLYINGRFWTVDTMFYTEIFHRADAKFLYYFSLTIPFHYYSTSTALPSMTQEDLSNHPLAIPPREEQTQIASFLDHETAQIDALIAEQQRLIELLKEKRQAVISHAVTKGLDPTAPMKDSGVEWLGEVPAYWAVKQLKHVVDPTTSITYGIVQAGPEVEDGIPYIKTSDMAGDTLPIEGYSKTSLEIDASYQRSKVRDGDIVVTIRATVGKCLPVPPELEGANLTQGTAKVSPGNSVLADYLLLALRSESGQAYLNSMSKGATFKEITLDALRRTPLALPPLSDQSNIVTQLKSILDNLEALMSEAIKAQLLLTERRSALISAAVTGKIDVRGWQAPASAAPAPTLVPLRGIKN